jgi:hypothetical protein
VTFYGHAKVCVPPRRVPAAGAVLALRPGQAKWHTSTLRVRVARPLPEISCWYDGEWCWVEAELLGEHGGLVDVLSVLVHVDAVSEGPA